MENLGPINDETIEKDIRLIEDIVRFHIAADGLTWSGSQKIRIANAWKRVKQKLAFYLLPPVDVEAERLIDDHLAKRPVKMKKLYINERNRSNEELLEIRHNLNDCFKALISLQKSISFILDRLDVLEASKANDLLCPVCGGDIRWPDGLVHAKICHICFLKLSQSSNVTGSLL